MTEDDVELWQRAMRDVTPLGQPLPSRPPIRPLHPPVVRHRLDLHGLTVAEAHRQTLDFMEQMERSAIIVTGRSGAIRAEFEHWIEQHQVERLKGNGAFRVKKRRKS